MSHLPPKRLKTPDHPFGVQNGVNHVFTLNLDPAFDAGIALIHRGRVMVEGPGADYTIAGRVITINPAYNLLPWSDIRAWYSVYPALGPIPSPFCVPRQPLPFSGLTDTP